MALTPEDVVKKEFTKPKGFGRSGYDEIQVDDFLDEIVVELRRLNAENEDLTGKLEDCRRSKGLSGRAESDAKSSTSATSAANVPALATTGAGDKDASSKELAAAKEELSTVQAKLGKAKEELAAAKQEQTKVEGQTKEAQQRLQDLKAQIAKAEQDEKAAQERVKEAGKGGDGSTVAAAAGGAAAGGATAAGVIELAQRLHDEHVKEGETTRDRLVAEAKAHHEKVVGEANAKRDQLLNEGQSKHDELVGKGQSKHDELVKSANDKSTTMVKEAEERKNKILGELSSERDKITKDIEQLRTFERDYRTKLKGYIQGQLQQLDQTSVDDASTQSSHQQQG